MWNYYDIMGISGFSPVAKEPIETLMVQKALLCTFSFWDIDLS